MAVKGKQQQKQAPKQTTKKALGVVVDLNEWDLEVTKSSEKFAAVKITADDGLTYYGVVFGKDGKALHEGTFEGDALYFELRREEYNGQWRDRLVCQGE